MGSRVEQVGSIFSRMTGLLRSGALKWEERPLWYDIYAANPPKEDPVLYRPKPADVTVRPILYAEDTLRAQFYKRYGSPGVISLANESSRTLFQIFMEYYEKIAAAAPKDTTQDELMEKTAQVMEEDGIFVKRRERTAFEEPVEKIEKPLRSITEDIEDIEL